jgi:hypothetical protein
VNTLLFRLLVAEAKELDAKLRQAREELSHAQQKVSHGKQVCEELEHTLGNILVLAMPDRGGNCWHPQHVEMLEAELARQDGGAAPVDDPPVVNNFGAGVSVHHPFYDH